MVIYRHVCVHSMTIASSNYCYQYKLIHGKYGQRVTDLMGVSSCTASFDLALRVSGLSQSLLPAFSLSSLLLCVASEQLEKT